MQAFSGRTLLQDAGDFQDANIAVRTPAGVSDLAGATAAVQDLAADVNAFLACFAQDTAWNAAAGAYRNTGYLKIRCPIKFGPTTQTNQGNAAAATGLTTVALVANAANAYSAVIVQAGTGIGGSIPVNGAQPTGTYSNPALVVQGPDFTGAAGVVGPTGATAIAVTHAADSAANVALNLNPGAVVAGNLATAINVANGRTTLLTTTVNGNDISGTGSVGSIPLGKGCIALACLMPLLCICSA